MMSATVLAVLLITQLVFTNSHAAAAEETQAQPLPASAFALKNTKGGMTRLSDYKGRVVLINFWATWCAPCQAEMPELKKLQTRYRSRGLQIIGIACPPERRSVVLRTMRKFRLNYPVLSGTRVVTGRYQISDVLPVTIVVDRVGNIRARILGILEPEEFKEKVAPLL
jgi:thiol-disulfide isomerase/thioredoxin